MTTRSQLKTILAKRDAHLGLECPECGERTGIEDNGCAPGQSLRDVSYGCHGGNGCGAQWDAEDYELTAEEECALEDAGRG